MSNVWTLDHVFATRADAHPDRTLLVAAGRTMTYVQVQARATALAAALAELGIGAGDRIAINLPNWPEWIVTLLAASRLGATLMGDFCGSYDVRGVAGGSRLLAKIRVRYPRGPYGAILRRTMPSADLFMFRKQLLTLRAYAERDARGI